MVTTIVATVKMSPMPLVQVWNGGEHTGHPSIREARERGARLGKTEGSQGKERSVGACGKEVGVPSRRGAVPFP